MAKRPLRGGRLTARRLESVARAWGGPLTLRVLRMQAEVTQVDLAERMDVTQAQVSQTEGREDLLLSTARRYVEALGGTLELHVRVGSGRVKLDL